MIPPIIYNVVENTGYKEVLALNPILRVLRKHNKHHCNFIFTKRYPINRTYIPKNTELLHNKQVKVRFSQKFGVTFLFLDEPLHHGAY